MKFVMTQAVCPEGMQLLDGIADVYVADNQDPNNYLDEMKDADALIVRIAKCDANAIENSPKLKVIGRTGVGYDSVDVKKATELGIPVVITPGANNRSVAEHAVAMIFALSKNLIEAQNEMCKRKSVEQRRLSSLRERQSESLALEQLEEKQPKSAKAVE